MLEEREDDHLRGSVKVNSALSFMLLENPGRL
jgi:hypothetical protein